MIPKWIGKIDLDVQSSWKYLFRYKNRSLLVKCRYISSFFLTSRVKDDDVNPKKTNIFFLGVLPGIKLQAFWAIETTNAGNKIHIYQRDIAKILGRLASTKIIPRLVKIIYIIDSFSFIIFHFEGDRNWPNVNIFIYWYPTGTSSINLKKTE